MNSDQEAPAHPPETLEGWYALHQIFTIGGAPASRAPVASTPQAGVASSRQVGSGASRVEPTLPAVSSPSDGWTAVVRLIGSSADVMVVHFRQTLDGIGEAQEAVRRLPVMQALTPVYSFLSVTEAGLYHLTAQLARDAAQRGGAVGDEAYVAELARRAAAERDTPHVNRRLYPPIPDGMPYVCFYPMTKRRDTGQNWYSLTLDERSRLMQTHGMTGRRYAGRVVQIISGAIGFDAWEWGVTLFAKDPLDFKKLVTDMRFDEVSAKYAEFGEFYVGKLSSWGELDTLVETRGG